MVKQLTKVKAPRSKPRVRAFLGPRSPSKGMKSYERNLSLFGKRVHTFFFPSQYWTLSSIMAKTVACFICFCIPGTQKSAGCSTVSKKDTNEVRRQERSARHEHA